MASRARASFTFGTAMVLMAAALLLVTAPLPATGRAPYNDAALPENTISPLDTPINRLPNTYTLYNYQSIQIEPNYKEPLEETDSFDGEVKIDFRVTTATTNIVLNAGTGIFINNVSVSRLETDLQVSSQVIQNDILTITMSQQLTSGTNANPNIYTVTISYSGIFQNDTRGFYKSTYNKNGDENGVLFTTHFQPVHARKAFPCFDEPKWKIPFKLTIDVPEGYDALSNNAPVESRSPVTTDDNSLTRITFQQTASMSSYLVAFVVYEKSSFVPTHEVITDDGVSIISWGHKEAVDNKLLDYSQEISFKILQNLEEYTGIKYGANMDKMDQVAVPDFAAGAMENWGLIIYRQTRLFFNETGDSEATRKAVAAIIAHEMTHQWFGNLVTTEWWDTTWLNEGFARYFQYLILSRLYPHWRMMDQFLLDQQMTIFVSDSVLGTLPLTYVVDTIEAISSQFGTITYSKGACIVRMLSYIMGEDIFQNGLQEYLKGTNVVTPTTLFTVLSKHIPVDREPPVSLATAMEPWLSKSGFPVVHVERNYSIDTATFSQYRFFTDGTIETEDNATIYNIPITWSSNGQTKQEFFWFSENVTLNDVPAMENWMLVHANGYYRVNYDEANWIALCITMAGRNQERVPPAERAQLVNDAFALTRLGTLNYRILRYVLRYLRAEKDVLPWAAANSGLRFLELPLGNVDVDGVFYAFVRRSIAAVYDALSGFSNRGDPPELIHRGTVLEWACRAGNKQCLDEAVHLLGRHYNNKDPLDPNLKEIIRCYGARAGSNSLWEHLWDEFAAEEDETARLAFLKNLACSEDLSTLQTLFDRLMREKFGGRQSDLRPAFQAALSHPKGIATTLDYVMFYLPTMQSNLPADDINDLISDLVDKLTSETQRQKFHPFLEEQLLNGLMEEEVVDSLQAKMRANVAEVQQYAEDSLKAFAYGASDDPLYKNLGLQFPR